MLSTNTWIGRLVADPELRFTPNGKAVATFRFAENDSRRNEQGQWEDGDSTFLTGTVWGQAAENLVESVEKGDMLLIVGRLAQRSYETEQGEKRTVYEVKVIDVGPSTKFATAKVTRIRREQRAEPRAEAPAGGPREAAADEPPPF